MADAIFNLHAAYVKNRLISIRQDARRLLSMMRDVPQSSMAYRILNRRFDALLREIDEIERMMFDDTQYEIPSPSLWRRFCALFIWHHWS